MTYARFQQLLDHNELNTTLSYKNVLNRVGSDNKGSKLRQAVIGLYRRILLDKRDIQFSVEFILDA
jgi:hypothetical protein